jgi:hypothetical protein
MEIETVAMDLMNVTVHVTEDFFVTTEDVFDITVQDVMDIENVQMDRTNVIVLVTGDLFVMTEYVFHITVLDVMDIHNVLMALTNEIVPVMGLNVTTDVVSDMHRGNAMAIHIVTMHLMN